MTFLIGLALKAGIPAHFAKLAVVIALVVTLVAALAVAQCSYDRSVIKTHDAKRNAAVARAARAADAKAAEQRRAGDAVQALPRVFISTDLMLTAQEKDDVQSLIHALLYQDKMDIVGIASSPARLKYGRVEDIRKVLDAYAQDYPKIRAHGAAFKTPEQLKAVSYQGATKFVALGWKFVVLGWSGPTDASRAIIAEAKKAAAAGVKLNVLTWGGVTDLAQALKDDPTIAPHIRFFNVNNQDPDAHTWIKAWFKGKFDMWVDNRSTFRGMYQTPTSAGLIPNWHLTHAKGRGALGDLFAQVSSNIFGQAGVKMGDSPTVLRFLSGNQDDPTQESWGGEFINPSPRYFTDNPSPALDLNRENTNGAYTVYEDRAAYLRSFAERLGWL